MSPSSLSTFRIVTKILEKDIHYDIFSKCQSNKQIVYYKMFLKNTISHMNVRYNSERDEIVNYTGPQSFLTTLSYSLAQNFFVLYLYFNWMVPN